MSIRTRANCDQPSGVGLVVLSLGCFTQGALIPFAFDVFQRIEDWGSVGDWFAGFGTMLAAGIAVWAALASARERTASDRREALLVASYIAPDLERASVGALGLWAMGELYEQGASFAPHPSDQLLTEMIDKVSLARTREVLFKLAVLPGDCGPRIAACMSELDDVVHWVRVYTETASSDALDIAIGRVKGMPDRLRKLTTELMAIGGQSAHRAVK